jgi:hypothetical protein
MGEIISKIVAILLLVLVFSIIFAIPTMLLWNWLMPVIFGLPTITLWQSIGLMILCGILFKSSTSSK